MNRVFVLFIFSMFLAIMFVNTNCSGVEDTDTNINNVIDTNGRPVVTFSSPITNITVTNSNYLVQGTSSDAETYVKNVYFQANSGGYVCNWSGVVSNWSTNLYLFIGSNLIEVYGIDSVSNYSLTNSVYIFYDTNTYCPPVTDLILTNTTGADPSGRFTGSLQSNIVIAYNNSNWIATDAGWDEDECLASPTHILDYAKGEWNRTHKGAYQFVTFPVCGINNCESASDSVCPQTSSNGTKGDLSELWFTWDANWVYVGVKSQMELGFDTGNGAGQGVNIMVLFDRERNYGMTNFSTQAIWNKGIYTTDFDTDLYIGAYGGWGAVSAHSLGGIQALVYDNSVDTKKAQRSPADPGSELWPAAFEAYYNGDNETDADERVLLFKMRMDLFTNSMSTVSSVTLKIIALSVDGSCGAGATTYDFLPDSKSAMSGSGANVADNYFLVPFTDANGKVLTNIRPKYDSKIKFLPGSVQ